MMTTEMSQPARRYQEKEVRVASISHPSRGHRSGSGPAPKPSTVDKLEARMQTWLRDMGLGTRNPFAIWDAGADADLSRYLVQPDLFRTTWQDRSTILYAPAGGGKTAFRVRLSWACRVEEDGRRILAINYVAPDPDATSLDSHLPQILKRAARELLLALVHRPARFLLLEAQDRQAVCRAMDQNDPGLLARFLPRIHRAGSLVPLADALDPTASSLTEPPDAQDVKKLCTALAETPAGQVPSRPEERLDDLLHVALQILGYEAVYLLVDGVDAWLETQRRPEQAIVVLTPLLEQVPAWAAGQLFLKLFLPIELRKAMPEQLTKNLQSDIIRWGYESLSELLRRRLSAASEGDFDSLDAISAPSLRGAEDVLLKALGPLPNPRDLVALVNRVIIQHVRPEDENETHSKEKKRSGIEHGDVRAAIDWYSSLRQPSSR